MAVVIEKPYDVQLGFSDRGAVPPIGESMHMCGLRSGCSDRAAV